jgi:glycosyltransferase involved in cell wall biosynthesis
MSKKVLIFYPLIKERAGGPATYLYNLKQFVNNNNLNDKIFFLSDYIIQQSNCKRNSWKKYLKQYIKIILNYFPFFYNKIKIFRINMLIFRHLLETRKGGSSFPLPDDFSINNYDYIHFHSSFDICLYRKMLNGFKGKTILTSHMPEAPHLEFIHGMGININDVWNINIKYFYEFENMAFGIPDFIIFPCQEAIEPYYNTFPPFKKIIAKHKVRYVPTGIISAQYKTAKENIRIRYKIPKDEIVLCYVGRHNSIKGYDILLEFGRYILNKYDHVTFLIGGKEYPFKGLKHNKWIEIGWTDDPYSIINAADIFILPNRETYFDLISLEVMSLGKPILLSYTGGNKYFKQFSSNGLIYFNANDVNDMIQVFIKSLENRLLWNEYGKLNRDIYNNYFNINIFGMNYLKVIDNELT